MTTPPTTKTSREEPMRSSRVDRWIIIGWVAIVLKSIAVWSLCQNYEIPVHPNWIIVPTLLMAALCTLIYMRKR